MISLLNSFTSLFTQGRSSREGVLPGEIPLLPAIFGTRVFDIVSAHLQNTETPYSEAVPILEIDYNQPDTILYKGQPITICRKQFQLICLLAKSPGTCVPRKTIYNNIWSNLSSVSDLQIKYHKSMLLSAIRKQFPDDPDIDRLIVTIRNAGLKLNLRSEEVKVSGVGLRKIKKADPARLNQRQIKVLRHVMIDKMNVTTRDYCAQYDVSSRTASRDLRHLVKSRMIRTCGHGRGVYYRA